MGCILVSDISYPWKSCSFQATFMFPNPCFHSSSVVDLKGFSGSSAGKESACNAGDPSSIPGLGRSPEEEIGYSLQYS